jgi:hypothetical protein
MNEGGWWYHITSNPSNEDTFFTSESSTVDFLQPWRGNQNPSGNLVSNPIQLTERCVFMMRNLHIKNRTRQKEKVSSQRNGVQLELNWAGWESSQDVGALMPLPIKT